MRFFFTHIHQYFFLGGIGFELFPLCDISCRELHWCGQTPFAVLVQTCEKANLECVLRQWSLDHPWEWVSLTPALSWAVRFNFLLDHLSVWAAWYKEITGLDPCCSFLLTLLENFEGKAVSALRLNFGSLSLPPKYIQPLVLPSFRLCRTFPHMVFNCASCCWGRGGEPFLCVLPTSPIGLTRVCHHLPVSHINSLSICLWGCIGPLIQWAPNSALALLSVLVWTGRRKYKPLSDSSSWP